jgi:hypothetical protein
MRTQNELHSPEDYERGFSGSDGFNGLCDMCSFHVSCRSDYDEVKRLCDDHNAKNAGHDAAPINC